jgi:hypothetical protein
MADQACSFMVACNAHSQTAGGSLNVGFDAFLVTIADTYLNILNIAIEQERSSTRNR